MLTLHMLVCNEEKLLAPLLEYVHSWVNDIAVAVDSKTTDSTIDILKQYRARYIVVNLNMNFARARNEALDLVRTPWVLHLDADEWPQPELLKEINKFTSDSNNIERFSGAMVIRENLVGGKPIGANTYECHIRIFNSKARFNQRIHERLNVNPYKCVTIRGDDKLLLHHKTIERQEKQNEFYSRWPEQRRL